MDGTIDSVAAHVGLELADCLILMSNPILTSSTRTASTAASLRTISSRPQADYPARPSSDVAAADFRAALNKIDLTDSSDRNESGVSTKGAVSSPPRSVTSTPSNVDAAGFAHTTGIPEQNDMLQHNEVLAQADAVVAGSPRAGLPSPMNGTGASGSIQPPPGAGLGQARFDTRAHPLTNSRSSESVDRPGDAKQADRNHVPLLTDGRDPAPSAQQAALVQTRTQQTNDGLGDSAQSLDSDPAIAGLSDPTPRKGQIARPPSSETNAVSSEHRSGHVRTGKESHGVENSTASDRAELNPDQIPAVSQIVAAGSVAVMAAASALPLDARPQLKTSPEPAGVDQAVNRVPVSRDVSGRGEGDASNVAHLSAIEGPTAASPPPHLPSARVPRVEDKASEATPPVAGSSEDMFRAASHRSSSDANPHLPGKVAPTLSDSSGSGVTFAAIETPPITPTAPEMGNRLLAAEPTDAPVIDHPAQAAIPQLIPALISLATRTDGSNEIRVSLNPRDLGQVDVHLVRGSDGTTTVSITASNPDTLRDLSQNVHHLHAALDAANIAPDGRTMNFITAAAAPSDQGQTDLTGRGTSAQQDNGSRSSGGQDRAWQQGRQGDPGGNLSDDSGSYSSIAPVTSRKSWQLSGLNITA